MIVTHPNGIVRVELEHIGEGWSGEYQPDPVDGIADDEPLLRFTVERKCADGTWEAYDDASYCTGLSADLPEEEQRKYAQIILDNVAGSVTAGSSVKRACEELSWLGTPRLPVID